MKNLTKAWMLWMVIQALAVPSGLAQPAKTSSSFYEDRCNTSSDEILVTVFDTGGEAATVTIKVTNLVTDADSSYQVTRDDDARGDCDWLASSEGGLTDGETTVTLYKDTPYKIEFIKPGNDPIELFYLQCTSSVNRSLYGFHCPITAKPGGVTGDNDVFIDYDVQAGTIEVFPNAPRTATSFNDAVGSNWMIPHHIEEYCTSCTSSNIMDYFITEQIPADSETGPFKSNDDITVLDGFTWDFRNVELQFASGKKLKVDGTFEADGVTFTASGSTWDGIYFYSGSTGDIAESVLEKANSSAALYANNVSSLTVEDSQIENTGTSAYRMAVWAFGNAGTLKLSDNTITSHDGPTILFQNSVSAYLYNNDIVMDGATDGTLYVENTAAVDFAKSTGGSGFNVVKGGPGLYADGDVVLNAGSSSGTKDYNYLCSGLDLNAHDGGVLYAHYNYWWNGSIPTPVTSGGGVVYAANSRGSSNATCTTTSALARVAEAAPSLGTRSAVALMDAAAEQPTDAEEDLFAAKALVEQQRYGEALGLFEQMEVAGAVYSGTMLLLK